MSREARESFPENEDPRKLWKDISWFFTKETQLNSTSLVAELMNVRMKAGERVDEAYGRFMGIVNRLEAADDNWAAKMINCMLINMFRSQPSFTAVADMILQLEVSDKREILQRLRVQENSIKLQSTTGGSTAPSHERALVSNERHSDKPARKQSDRNKVYCHKCGSESHNMQKCTRKPAEYLDSYRPTVKEIMELTGGNRRPSQAQAHIAVEEYPDVWTGGEYACLATENQWTKVPSRAPKKLNKENPSPHKTEARTEFACVAHEVTPRGQSAAPRAKKLHHALPRGQHAISKAEQARVRAAKKKGKAVKRMKESLPYASPSQHPPALSWEASNLAYSRGLRHEDPLSWTASAEALVASTAIEREEAWILDSGATSHMTARADEMLDYRLLSEPITVGTAGGEQLLGVGMGTIRLQVEERVVELRDVLHVPSMRCSLLSARRFAEKGHTVYMSGGNVGIISAPRGGRRVPILEGKLEDGLYKVWGTQQISERAYLSGEAATKETWHRRLGHLNMRDVTKMAQLGSRIGMKMLCTAPPPKDGSACCCNACLKGKMHRTQLAKYKEIVSTIPLNLLHSDICGKMSCPTHQGYEYFATYVDDYSRFIFVALLKTKDEVVERLVQLVTMEENQSATRRSVKGIRSDNGSEYRSLRLLGFCSLKGNQTRVHQHLLTRAQRSG
jgi:hypothetical protein